MSADAVYIFGREMATRAVATPPPMVIASKNFHRLASFENSSRRSIPWLYEVSSYSSNTRSLAVPLRLLRTSRTTDAFAAVKEPSISVSVVIEEITSTH